MLKLKLNHPDVTGDVLTRDELKKVLGGNHYGSGTCAAFIPEVGENNWPSYGSLPPGSTWEAGSVEVDGNVGYTIFRGISKEFAQQITQGISGAKWCCENCASASWY